MSDDTILVATTTFVAMVDGKRLMVRKGVTNVRADHPVVRGRESCFTPLRPAFEVEQATAPPGRARHVALPEPEDEAEQKPKARRRRTRQSGSAQEAEQGE